jgi:hypothetical protein
MWNNVEQIVLTGHSLGGAVAALAQDFIDNYHPARCRVCLFASPRYCDLAAYSDRYAPTQIQRHGDIVPYVPPRSFGYADHPYQFNTAGEAIFEPISYSVWPFFVWRLGLFLLRRIEPHSMEAYRKELGRAAGAKWADELLTPYEKLTKAHIAT